jgi:pimeloyl-ACP methyl ester carboxylesterase
MNILGVLVAGYAAVVGLGIAFERRLMFPAPRQAVEPDARGGRLLRFPGGSGRTVHALFAAPPTGGPVIVHFHGNGESLEHLVHLSSLLRASGLGFFAPEYPGYGLSKAESISEQAIYDDAEAALVHLGDVEHVPRAQIVLEGQSLGTGVAIEMALRGHGSRLILISPYTSMPDMARRLVPFLPASLVVRDRFDNAAKASRVTLPALVVHGKNDELIPVSMGETIARLLPNAEFEVLPGVHHNDVWGATSLPARIAAFAGVTPDD